MDSVQEAIRGSRSGVLDDLRRWLNSSSVNDLFAYNAHFDKGVFPELNKYPWYDIMGIAANRKTNPHIPDDLRCYRTGRLRAGYKVENIFRYFGFNDYIERHNAMRDARDELKIMELLSHPLDIYKRYARL